ncbi:hypothetical protein P8452_13008 [Trifolium repens]|nr:hypothetical protein P8452_13008 [Trifolium repens]
MYKLSVHIPTLNIPCTSRARNLPHHPPRLQTKIILICSADSYSSLDEKKRVINKDVDKGRRRCLNSAYYLSRI